MRLLSSLRTSFYTRTSAYSYRSFSISSTALKDEKSKQLLKNLGLSLQKGNIKSDEESEIKTEHVEPQPSEQTLLSSQNTSTGSTANVTQSSSIPPVVTTKPSNAETTNSETIASPNNNAESTNSKSSTTSPTKESDNTLPPSYASEQQHNLSRLNDLYDSVSHMSADDLHIQQNLDQGRQLFSFNSHHFLNRKELIRSLPDELDLFNPEQLKKIESIYDKLGKLDNDKTVQFKYFKRYLRRYDDPINVLIQQFNGISKKFKLLRRKEIDNLSLAPGAYLYNENLFNLPYNVVGFDRSITGFPLRSGKHRLEDRCYPQEFVEDLQMYRTKIPIHKRDLDFIEMDENSTNVDPKKTIKSNISNISDISGFNGNSNSNNNNTELSKPEQINQFLNNIYHQLEIPKNSILIDSVDNYNSLDLHNDIVIRIENEVLLMKKSLQHEIEAFMKSSLNSRFLLYSNQELKHNQFKLCETHSTNSLNSSSLLIINYNLKEFSMIPNYSAVLASIKQRKSLRNHLFKIFLINLEDQIDTLFRVKYYNDRDMNKFMKRMIQNIGHVIKFKLLKLFKPLVIKGGYEALVYSPYLNGSNCFKRVYWLNNRVKRLDRDNSNRKTVLRRGALMIKWKKFDNLIEY
ncbi:uncharacterized protein RJT20DRAFT_35021 [Scheffersomyces xylosifermentans]|uniref:uncharacterized protein n=1 Tax=Scheffersomyces xylosifermentans TaxID=1304137 RepID=UPI00315CC9E8